MTVPNIPFVVEAGYTLTPENTAVSTFWYFQIMGLAVHNLEVPLLFWRPQKKTWAPGAHRLGVSVGTGKKQAKRNYTKLVFQYKTLPHKDTL